MERTSSVKLDEMLNFQRAALIKLVSGMITLSLSSCGTSSCALNNIMFVSPTSKAKPEIINPKIENVSKVKHDKGKSILE